MNEVTETLDEPAMLALAGRMAQVLAPGVLIFLRGPLGAGKTTFVRGLLRGLGYRGSVKSPTYTLVEPYEFEGLPVFHFDLYRLQDPAELEALGIRDYLDGSGACLVEWPERGAGLLPAPDLEVVIEPHDAQRSITLKAHSAAGRELEAAAR